MVETTWNSMILSSIIRFDVEIEYHNPPNDTQYRLMNVLLFWVVELTIMILVYIQFPDMPYVF